tara:strand:- start:263 stop:442 length:180 start_codon:yes stop_codon:yes gene_type:complete
MLASLQSLECWRLLYLIGDNVVRESGEELGGRVALGIHGSGFYPIHLGAGATIVPEETT